MRPEYKVREVYLGDGIQNTFTFDFKIVNVEDLLVLYVDPTGAIVWQARGNDTTYYTTLLNENLDGGTITWVTDEPAVGYEVIILLADDNPKQPSRYTVDSRYTMKKIEASLDTLSGQIQRMRYLLDRSLRLPEKITEAIATELVELIPEGVMTTDVNGNFTMTPITEFSNEEAGGSLPPGGDAFAILEKLSATDNDADWTDPLVYNGFTERFSELVNLQGAKAVIDYIMKMGYAPPTLSLGGSVSNAAREIGNAISSVDLSANVGKVLDDIGEVRFYLNPSTLLATQTSGPAIPNGGINTYTYATPFSTTQTFRAEVDDISAQPKPSRQATLTYPFYYPYFSGKGPAAVTPATIYSTFTKVIASTPATVVVSFSFAIGEKPYFAYPATFADLTSIKNVNNLETIGSWTKRTENMTNAYGQTTSYKIYEFNNLAGVANDNTYTFIR